jgi:GntR family transcriptional regulator
VKLIISNVSGIPIYVQIKQQIVSAILSGELGDDEMLPSLRQVSKELKISVLTTTRAYTELEQEGFIMTVQGKGCFIVPKGSEKVISQLTRKTIEAINEAIGLAKRAGLQKKEVLKMFEQQWEDINE